MLPKTNKSELQKKLKQASDVRVIGLVLFGVVVLLVSWSGLRVLQLNYELQKKESELTQKNQIQKLANENLKLKNTYFETDEYLELTARRQFNKAAKGEKLYLIPKQVAIGRTVAIPKPKTLTQQQADEENKRPAYQRNFEAWLDFIFHRTSD